MAISAALVWGTSWVATGMALREFTPAAVAAWRGMAAVTVMALLLAAGVTAALSPAVVARRRCQPDVNR